MGFVGITIPTAGLTNGYAKKIQIDFADKLNWQVTVNLLIIALIVVTNMRLFINKLISCTVPMHFSSNQEEYANEICFITGDKYFVMENERILIFKNESSKMQLNYIDEKDSVGEQPPLVSYYIFVPYILIIEAFLIVLPRKLWSHLLKKLGKFDMDEMLKASFTCKTFCNKQFQQVYLHRSKTVKFVNFNYLIKQIECWALSNFHLKNKNRRNNLGKKYLCIGYLVVKVLCILNIFILIFVINQLLGIDLFLVMYNLFGDFKNSLFKSNRILDLTSHNVYNSSESMDHQFQSFYLMNSKYFPLRSMCLFKIREHIQTNVYAVMCSLPINLFNQYIFILILVWFMVLFCFNVYYLLFWLLSLQRDWEVNYVKENVLNGFKVIASANRSDYNNKCEQLYHLSLNMTCDRCEQHFENYFNHFLSSDLVFFLKIISINSSDNLIQQILVYLWQVYRQNIMK